MSSLHTLVHSFTLYQSIFLFFILIFTIREVSRWSKLSNTNPGFIKRFWVRCSLMIISFALLTPISAFVVSFLSMLFVLIQGGFYKEIPDDDELEWYTYKHKTLVFKIPWLKFFQFLLWVFIDALAFFIWMIAIPWFMSRVMPLDRVLSERLF